jgi:hypothetical protein
LSDAVVVSVRGFPLTPLLVSAVHPLAPVSKCAENDCTQANHNRKSEQFNHGRPLSGAIDAHLGVEKVTVTGSMRRSASSCSSRRQGAV